MEPYDWKGYNRIPSDHNIFKAYAPPSGWCDNVFAALNMATNLLDSVGKKGLSRGDNPKKEWRRLGKLHRGG